MDERGKKHQKKGRLNLTKVKGEPRSHRYGNADGRDVPRQTDGEGQEANCRGGKKTPMNP